MDTLTARKRSLLMAKVKTKNTRPEMTIRSLLHARGFRFRNNVKKLPGSPDIVLAKYKTVIFVHGCFWHQHEGCRKSRRPTTRVEFWNDKLDKNIERDIDKEKLLESSGWKVLTVWECEISKKRVDDTIRKLTDEIHAAVSSEKTSLS